MNTQTFFAIAALTGSYLTLSATAEASCIVTEDGTGIYTETLYAGQTINAGTVSLEVDGDNLTVTYNTIDGWELTEAHLWTGLSLSDMPQTKKGNPQVGLFPYTTESPDSSTSHVFTVPLDDLGFSCPGDDVTYYIAAHAALRKDNGDGTYQTETGWGNGDRIVERGNWATYFNYTLTCDCDEPPPEPPEECETAFAYSDDGTCFLDIDSDEDGVADFNRWGWTIPVTDGTSETFDFYAAAGQCDLTKGTLVGTVTVSYSNGFATVEFDMDEGYTLDETHLYIGTDILATNNGEYTVAPGQYGNTNDLDAASSDTYLISGLSGDLYFVAHASVCGF